MRPGCILAVVNHRRPEAPTTVQQLQAWCETEGTPLRTMDLADALPIEPDERTLALSLGGDGTFLRTAELVAGYGTPILGINLGSLGFLTQTNSDAIRDALAQVWADEIVIEPRLRVHATVDTPDGRSQSALNEIVLSRPTIDTTTQIDLAWDETPIGRYPGDGIIVSTPSGSTGYNMAAWGPIVHPRVPCLTVTPLNAHRISLRPLVLPADADLEATMVSTGRLVLDGIERGELAAGATIRIRQAEKPARLVLLQRQAGFFELLRQKLGWSWQQGGR